jgi:hypothetical protein
MHEAKNDDGTLIGPDEIDDDITNLLYVRTSRSQPSKRFADADIALPAPKQ